MRVPYADFGPLEVPSSLTDEQVLFLSDIFPTGYMGAEFCEITPLWSASSAARSIPAS